MRQIGTLLIALVLLVGCFCMRHTKTSYTIFRSSNWKGMNFYGTEKSIQGFTDDLLFEIARKEHIRLQISTTDESQMLDLLDQKEVDAVLSTAVPTLQNQKLYLFSDPFFAIGPVLVMRAADSYDSLAALKGKVVGYEQGFGANLEAKDTLEIIFRTYDKMTYAMEDLMNGKIDAVVLDSIFANQYATGLYLNKIKVVSLPLKTIYFRLVVKSGSGNDELVELFNEGLEEIKEAGVYKKMLNYWGLYNSAL